MVYTALGSLIYAAWLLVPIVAIGLMIRRRVRLWLFGVAGLLLTLLACPAYAMLLILLPGWAWPPDIFMPGSEGRIGVDIPGYRVDYVQTWGADFYETYFEITRADNQKAYLEIDGDDNKCWGLSMQQVGARVYFLCGDEEISDRTSFFDIEQKIVYAGFVQCWRALDQLDYRDDAVNPFTSSPWIDMDVMCWDNIPRVTRPSR